MTDQCFSLWPEEPTPEDCLDCNKCGLAEHGTRMVWGEGNPDAPIVVLLDNPGAREDREHQPIVCGTRQTLQRITQHVGLTADDLYVTYVLKRRPTRKYDKENARNVCMHHFHQQLSDKQPRFIVCLGNVAVQSYFGDSNNDVKSLRGKIHEAGGYKTAVAYHPLAVRRRPNLWPLFVEDWQLIAEEYMKVGRQ